MVWRQNLFSFSTALIPAILSLQVEAYVAFFAKQTGCKCSYGFNT